MDQVLINPIATLLVVAAIAAEINLLRVFVRDALQGRRERRKNRLSEKGFPVQQTIAPSHSIATQRVLAASLLVGVALSHGRIARACDDESAGQSLDVLVWSPAECRLTFQPERVPATRPDTASDQPTRRAKEAPWSSPPFPGGEYLGPTIGVPNSTPDYFLMHALKDTVLGRFQQESRIDMYGWVNVGFNWSSSKHSNLPNVYDVIPNKLELNQAVLRLERNPDTVQTDHVDWGFRVSNLYGTDYRFTVAKGWFDKELLDHNRTYGFDMPELYGLIYFPKIAEGMVLKIGRYISPPDIEAQLAPDNYLFSHSTMFSIDPYTFTGVTAMIKLNDQWSIQPGVHAGNDMAPWSDSAAPNGQFMVRWVSQDNNDSIWAGINSLGDGRYRNNHDNLQHIVGTWSHRFNDKVHMATEVYYMWQRDALKGGSVIDGPVRDYGTGGGPGPLIPGLSDSLGAVNYFQVQLTDKDYLSIRNDFLADYKGQRTGITNYYSSHTIGWIHWLNDSMIIRPELKYERAWTNPAYDNGREHDQFKFGIDLIIRF